MKVIIQDRFRIIVASPGPQGPQGPAGSGGGGGGSVDWGQIGGTLSAQTDLDTALSGKAATSHTHAWADITSGVPTTFTPSAHTHAAADVTSGTFDSARIPTLALNKLSNISGSRLVGNAGIGSAAPGQISVAAPLALNSSTNTLEITGVAVDTVQMIAGTGLTGGGTISANRTFAVDFATTSTAGKAVEANDPRLSDARTPTAHTHPLTDLQQGGATTGQVIEWSGTAWAPASITGGGGGTVTSVTAGTGLTGGTITATGTIAADFGTAAGTICQGNDGRLSDARTPSAHTHGLTDSYVGFIEAAANKTYTIDFRAATTRTITDIRVQSTAGTCTAAIKNGANTVGTVSVTSTSGGSSPSLSNTSVSGSDPVSIEISSNSNAVNVSFAITYTRVTGAIS
jgi:hypothetical protein